MANGRHEPEASTSSSTDTAFPSSSTFTFDVESLLSDPEKAAKRKDAGNVAFKAKRYGEALDLYMVRCFTGDAGRMLDRGSCRDELRRHCRTELTHA